MATRSCLFGHPIKIATKGKNMDKGLELLKLLQELSVMNQKSLDLTFAIGNCRSKLKNILEIDPEEISLNFEKKTNEKNKSSVRNKEFNF